jgi:hypothetical protein
MMHPQSPELAKPGVGSFDDPTPLVASQFTPIFVAPMPIVLPVRRDQLDTAFLQSLAERVPVIGGVGNHPFRLLPRAAFGPPNSSSVNSFCRCFMTESHQLTCLIRKYLP